MMMSRDYEEPNLKEKIMKVIEQILLQLNKSVSERNIKAIEDQIDYSIKYKMEVEGISLIPVRDALGEDYTDETLRRNGFILTIAQLKEDCEKFLKLAQEKPLSYNSHLKRLHRNFEVFEACYISGNVANAKVIAEMKEHFAKILQDSYCHGTEPDKKMPKALAQLIVKRLEARIVSLNDAWYENKLAPEFSRLFSEILAKNMLEDWRKNRLNANIVQKLHEEKKAINSTTALTRCFQDSKLPHDIQVEIKKHLIGEITGEISARRISPLDDFGVAIKAKREFLIENDSFNVISAMIVDWQNNQINPNVGKQIECFLNKVIVNMKDRLDSSLTQQFEALAVNIFLEKLQQKRYENSFNVEKYSLEVGQSLLSGYNNDPQVKEFQQKIYLDVMLALHDDWISNTLSGEINEFLKTIVFASLNELCDRIERAVWPSQYKNEMEQLKNTVQEQSKQMQRMTTELEKLTKILTDNVSLGNDMARDSSGRKPGFFAS